MEFKKNETIVPFITVKYVTESYNLFKIPNQSQTFGYIKVMPPSHKDIVQFYICLQLI